MKFNNLSKKVAIISGASKGIGKEIALKLASQGTKTTLISRNFKELEIVSNEIISLGGESLSLSCDISNYNDFSKVVSKTLEKWAKIDILINNAGITKDNIIMRMKEDEWSNVIDINLKGCFNGIKAVSRPMIKNKSGKIINVTSVIAQIGNAGQSNYAASKAGIIGLTKSIAKELASRNINVNSVAPGYIETDMTNKLTNEKKEELKNLIPLGRIGKPIDIANLICFLASDEASYITGQTFNVDGGMVMI